jgi:hypothetical protein
MLYRRLASVALYAACQGGVTFYDRIQMNDLVDDNLYKV